MAIIVINFIDTKGGKAAIRSAINTKRRKMIDMSDTDNATQILGSVDKINRGSIV